MLLNDVRYTMKTVNSKDNLYSYSIFWDEQENKEADHNKVLLLFCWKQILEFDEYYKKLTNFPTNKSN